MIEETERPDMHEEFRAYKRRVRDFEHTVSAWRDARVACLTATTEEEKCQAGIILAIIEAELEVAKERVRHERGASIVAVVERLISENSIKTT